MIAKGQISIDYMVVCWCCVDGYFNATSSKYVMPFSEIEIAWASMQFAVSICQRFISFTSELLFFVLRSATERNFVKF